VQTSWGVLIWGLPVPFALFNSVQALPLDDAHEQVAAAKAFIDALCPEPNILVLHAAQDTLELRALGPDWPSRVANYEAMLSRELREHLRRSGARIIGYGPLRDWLRTRS